MPYVEGESLRDRLEREKRLDVDALLAIARPVAQALSWGLVAHRFYETNRFFAPLRGHPRFEALLERAREKERAFDA
jgi:hypothetical protein